MTNATKFHTVTTRSHTATIGDDVEIDLPFEADEMVDPFLSEDGNTFRYGVRDDSPHEYELPEGVEFVQGNPRNVNYVGDVETWLEGMNDNPNVVVFPVDVYEHGDILYSLSGSGPQCQFDTARGGACIAVPTGPEGFTNPQDAAAAILNEYTAWCNGDVYGIVEMNRDPETNTWTEGDTCWGFYGWEYAETVCKEGA